MTDLVGHSPSIDLLLKMRSLHLLLIIDHPLNSVPDLTGEIFRLYSVVAVSFLASVPFGVFVDLMIDNQRGPRIVFCRERWPSIFAVRASQIYVVIVTYIIPLSVIMVCYSLMLKKIWRNKSSIKPSSNQQVKLREIEQDMHVMNTKYCHLNTL